MPQTPPPKVFISYAWENQSLARQLQRDLQNDGVEVFVDYAELKGGDSLPARISKALDWCDTLVLLWSKDAAQSRWVAREWECADQLERRIIPCKLDDAVLPALMRNMVYLDFADYENGYEELCKTLGITLASEDEIKKQFLREPIAKPTNGKIKKEKRGNWMTIAAMGAFIVAALSLSYQVYKDKVSQTQSPQFKVTNSQITPDSVIIIIAANKAASRSVPLNIKFDGSLFNEAGKVIPKSKPQQWTFRLKDHNPIAVQIADGTHQMRVGFPGMELSGPLEITFTIDAPQFKIKNPDTHPDSAIIIVSQNEAAARRTPLNVEFDGQPFIEAGEIISASQPPQWSFRLKTQSPPAALIRNGMHQMRVGFPGMQYSDFFEITFATKALPKR